jgi:hypothetical protein
MDSSAHNLSILYSLRASHALSVALARRDGCSIVLVVDDARGIYNPYERDMIPHVERIFAKVSDQYLLDSTGLHDISVVETNFLQGNEPERAYRIITLDGELALSQFVGDDWDHRLFPLNDDEIIQTLSDLSS